MSDETKKLELRIVELENRLKQFQAAAAPTTLTAEEIAAFRKVSATLTGYDDWGCGINECQPIGVCRVCVACRVCRVCRVCINECVCGPCLICTQGGAGGGFTGFGG